MGAGSRGRGDTDLSEVPSGCRDPARVGVISEPSGASFVPFRGLGGPAMLGGEEGSDSGARGMSDGEI